MSELKVWGEFARMVETGARKMGRRMVEPQVEQFVRHAKELVEWNRSVNLTALCELHALAEKQFLDVIPLAGILPEGWRVLDVGSGGGFPGVPLKILRPDLEVVLIDSVRKKTSFLKHLVRSLRLDDVVVRHGRAESLVEEREAGWRQWDAVVSKAVGKVRRVVQLCAPLVREEGWLVVMKGGGEKSHEEVTAVTRDARFEITRHGYELPFTGLERCLLVLQKPTSLTQNSGQ